MAELNKEVIDMADDSQPELHNEAIDMADDSQPEFNNEFIDMADDSQPKGSSVGKKIGCGCGCGCLLIIIAFFGVIIYFYSIVTGYVDDFADKGYERVQCENCGIEEGETIDGDIVYMGSVIKINGTVNGNVAALCQQLTISGTVNGDLDLMCQQVTITETGKVTGSIRAEAVQQLINNGSVGGTITGEIQSQTGSGGQ